MDLGELPPFPKHVLGFCCDYLGADVAVDDVANAPDLIFDRIAFFGNQRRVGGDSVSQAEFCGLSELVQIGGIEKELHNRLLTEGP